MAVGYWESKLLGKIFSYWRRLPAHFLKAANLLANMTASKILKRHFDALLEAHKERRVMSAQLQVHATLHIGHAPPPAIGMGPHPAYGPRDPT